MTKNPMKGRSRWTCKRRMPSSSGSGSGRGLKARHWTHQLMISTLQTKMLLVWGRQNLRTKGRTKQGNKQYKPTHPLKRHRAQQRLRRKRRVLASKTLQESLQLLLKLLLFLPWSSLAWTMLQWKLPNMETLEHPRKGAHKTMSWSFPELSARPCQMTSAFRMPAMKKRAKHSRPTPTTKKTLLPQRQALLQDMPRSTHTKMLLLLLLLLLLSFPASAPLLLG
mmetsp:Transcript_51812/g.110052  ORF Transcript_51812/g.110052 Transcript_51812/m.110052 type:complete len:223 (+) Transcript_51812:1810-2478(+)